MKYEVDGITCSACKQLIEMDLEDRGFKECLVSVEDKTIEIPNEYRERIPEIANVVSGAGAYTLVT